MILDWDKRDLLLALHAEKDAAVTYGQGLDPYQRVGVKFLATAGRAIEASFPGAGKQQPIDALVQTPKGWRRIGNLCVGDVVTGSNGRPTKVVGVYPQGVRPSYWVQFSDGVRVEAGLDHLWAVAYSNNKTRRRAFTLTTRQLLVQNLNVKKKKLYIPMLSSPVIFEPQNKLSSLKNRIALFHSLMNKNGFVGSASSSFALRNKLNYTAPSKHLANFVELVEGLGGTGHYLPQKFTERTLHAMHTVQLRLPLWLPPFTLPRKLFKYEQCHRRWQARPVRRITGVTYSRHTESVCIEVDAADGLYVTEHCVVTHNSAMSIRAACEVNAARVLVITRKSLFANWRNQLDLWLPETCTEILFEITNYEQVVAHPERFKGPYDVLIIDEATCCKDRRTKRSKAICKLACSVENVWMLTGTPIRNRLDELWMLLHILHPKQYRSYWTFVNTYCVLARNPYSYSLRPTVVVGLKAEIGDALAQELAPVLLRRTRAVVNLPPITRETVLVELTGKQSVMYKQMEKDFFVTLDNFDTQSGGATLLHAPSVVAQLVRLRQITCSPLLIGGPDVSAKTDVLVGLLEEYAGDYKVLVFTTFARYADVLALKLAPYGAVKVTGKVPAKERDNALETFAHNPACRVLVGTYGTTSEGHNIQVADVVVLADKPWVPDIVEQAESRTYRRGRDNPVHVVSLVAKNTVDAHVETVLSEKTKLISAVDAVIRIVSLMRERR